MTRLKILLVIIYMYCVHQSNGQQLPVYNQFFLNQSLYNPSFLGASGYTELNINQRYQWVGIEGAPITTNINLQVPLNGKVALGMFLLSDKAGLLSTYQADFGVSYLVRLGTSSNLSFGLAAGMERNTIDPSVVDQSIGTANGSQLTGQFGINFQHKNLVIGFALPKLFETDLLNEFSLDETTLAPLKTTFTSLGYQFNTGHQFSIKPTLFYLTDMNTVNQIGGLAAFYYEDLIWFGGGYKQDVGPNAFLGFNIKNFIQVGYDYEFASGLSDKIGNGSHEFQVRIRLGKTNKRPPTTTPATEEVTIATEEVKPELKEPPKEVLAVTPILIQPPIDEKPAVKEEMPMAETITKIESDRSGEMPPGYYVVVGAFINRRNAEKYLGGIKAAGFSGSIGANQKSGYNYVYLNYFNNTEEAKKRRDEVKKINQFEFSQTWVLQIQ